YIADGYKYVVDIDLSKYFDTINHDKLIGMIDKTLTDKDIRRLIFDYLKSGIMENNKVIKSKEGTMQGGPLSPILANIYLTPFDKKLESKQIRFTRFADDILCKALHRMSYGKFSSMESFSSNSLQRIAS
ncbi:MAG: group II intron reverse transcriptase/maturase, partial [Spirochaetia bacterium]|nr:group II intron reverse transcriptase/maturase [Spirochaetia bacterium]